jgi:hypothetical protein
MRAEGFALSRGNKAVPRIQRAGSVIVFSNPQLDALSTTTDGPLHNCLNKPPADTMPPPNGIHPYAEDGGYNRGSVRLEESSGHAAPLFGLNSHECAGRLSRCALTCPLDPVLRGCTFFFHKRNLKRARRLGDSAQPYGAQLGHLVLTNLSDHQLWRIGHGVIYACGFRPADAVAAASASLTRRSSGRPPPVGDTAVTSPSSSGARASADHFETNSRSSRFGT